MVDSLVLPALLSELVLVLLEDGHRLQRELIVRRDLAADQNTIGQHTREAVAATAFGNQRRRHSRRRSWHDHRAQPLVLGRPVLLKVAEVDEGGKRRSLSRLVLRILTPMEGDPLWDSDEQRLHKLRVTGQEVLLVNDVSE